MSDGGDSGDSRAGQAPPGPDLQQLARDWITLWQSELAALAADRESQETWQAMLSIWAGAALAILRATPRQTPPHDGAAGRPGPAAPSRPAAAAAAPDPRDAEVERLARRVGELEARLAEFERGGGSGDRPGPRRRRR